MGFSSIVRKSFCVCVAVLAAAGLVAAQGVKRIVVLKIDGLPGYYVDKFVQQRDPATGKSVLPWFEEVFYRNGSRLENFYTRGMSLSGPSWGQLDTGQHLQIKGNVEYDRYTSHAYDYLNFFPYVVAQGLGRSADMPATEVMDQLGIPLLCDAFPYEKRYTSAQLYQRGNGWAVLASGFVNLFPRDPGDLIDEWTLGFDFRRVTVSQNERDIVGKLTKRPHIDYFDYYDTSFDHISHHNNDTASRLRELKKLDLTIGRIWMAMQASSRADETALVLVSDHGFNSDERVYSQGFNLVRLLGSSGGGGHHVVTKRRLLLDYSLKGLYPFVPLIRTESKESYYLKGKHSSYPTALLDFDGNERSSIHLRESDLNVLHMLLQQLQKAKLKPEVRRAATNAFFDVIAAKREMWKERQDELSEELGALRRWIESQEPVIAKLPKEFTAEDRARGLDQAKRRTIVLYEIAQRTEGQYRAYLASLSRLLGLDPETFDPKRVRIEDVIPPGAMGEQNSVYELQNYVVGLSPKGLATAPDGTLDLDASFSRVNYVELFTSQTVRNNVQPNVSNRPVDFVAVRVPREAIERELPPELRPTDDVVWLNGPQKQALILARNTDGVRRYRYQPVSGLRQDREGRITLRLEEQGPGFPLKLFEDENLQIADGEKARWLNNWHSDQEWLDAAHKTEYSTAVLGLHEQFTRFAAADEDDDAGLTEDERLLRRFRDRQRRLTGADLLLLANNHWNFDVRGFNPGGNHGSFFRVSTNSTFMLAGGSGTGIPRGLRVEQPYDSLSFMPTILRLMGKIDDENQPIPELRALGFRRFPGRVVRELTDPAPRAAPTK